MFNMFQNGILKILKRYNTLRVGHQIKIQEMKKYQN